MSMKLHENHNATSLWRCFATNPVNIYSSGCFVLSHAVFLVCLSVHNQKCSRSSLCGYVFRWCQVRVFSVPKKQCRTPGPTWRPSRCQKEKTWNTSVEGLWLQISGWWLPYTACQQGETAIFRPRWACSCGKQNRHKLNSQLVLVIFTAVTSVDSVFITGRMGGRLCWVSILWVKLKTQSRHLIFWNFTITQTSTQ